MVRNESPAYVRLRGAIAAAILDGTYPDAAPLPSVRSLAAEHGLNPLTVAKAYQSFQDDGLITVRRGVGMFVAAGAADRLRQSARARFMDETWPEVLRQMRVLGLSPRDLLEHVPA
jgi:GntR family transcriptional regulator